MSTQYWMAESEIKVHKENLQGTLVVTTVKVWAVGTGDKEIAWFMDRQDALDFKSLLDGDWL